MENMQQMKPSGDTDKDFAEMMKMHHQQAIRMARIEAQSGKSQEMKSLAQKIIDASNRDIGEIDRWMKARR